MTESIATTTVANILATTTKCTKHLHHGANASNMSSHMSSHDHSAHGGSHGSGMHDMMMSMSFHFGYTETILFDFWKTDSITIFLLSCLILFIMAALYEGLKLIREKLIRDEIVRSQQLDVLRANTLSSTCHCDISKTAEQKALLDGGRTNGDAERGGLGANDEVTVATAPAHECCRDKKPAATTAATNNNSQHTSTRMVEDDESKLIVMSSYRTRLLSQAHLIQTFLHMLQITVSYLLMLVFMTYNTWLCLSVVLGAGLGYFLFGLKRLTTIDVNEHCH